MKLWEAGGQVDVPSQNVGMQYALQPAVYAIYVPHGNWEAGGGVDLRLQHAGMQYVLQPHVCIALCITAMLEVKVAAGDVLELENARKSSNCVGCSGPNGTETCCRSP